MKRLLLLLLLVCSVAQADITDLKIGTAQIFDVQWNMSGTTLNVSNMTRPFISVPNGRQMTIAEVNTITQSGQYFAFFPSSTNPGTYGLAIYNSDETLDRVVHNTGTFSKFGNGVIFYQGNNQWGTVISTLQGYSYGNSAQFTGTFTPTQAQITNYVPPSTTILAAGQQAGPTYVSNITPQQQTRINAWTLQTFSGSVIDIDHQGNYNTVTVEQIGTQNHLTGVGQPAAQIVGDSNDITVRQGGGSSNPGKNQVEMRVFGSSNTLNINQSVDQYGAYLNSTNGHYGLVDVSGTGNNVTTVQKNAGGLGNHYMETTITGNNNLVNTQQLDNGNKIMFTTIAGNNNTVAAIQKDAGQHYLDLKMTGNGNNATVVQEGNTQNRATIELTNSGGPSSVTLNQTGGQTYSLQQSCVTAAGCSVTIRQ